MGKLINKILLQYVPENCSESYVISLIIISRKPFPANISSGKNNFIMMTSLSFLFVLTAFFTIPVLIICVYHSRTNGNRKLHTVQYMCTKNCTSVWTSIALLSSTEARKVTKRRHFWGAMFRPNGKIVWHKRITGEWLPEIIVVVTLCANI